MHARPRWLARRRRLPQRKRMAVTIGLRNGLPHSLYMGWGLGLGIGRRLRLGDGRLWRRSPWLWLPKWPRLGRLNSVVNAPLTLNHRLSLRVG